MSLLIAGYPYDEVAAITASGSAPLVAGILVNVVNLVVDITSMAGVMMAAVAGLTDRQLASVWGRLEDFAGAMSRRWAARSSVVMARAICAG